MHLILPTVEDIRSVIEEHQLTDPVEDIMMYINLLNINFCLPNPLKLDDFERRFHSYFAVSKLHSDYLLALGFGLKQCSQKEISITVPFYHCGLLVGGIWARALVNVVERLHPGKFITFPTNEPLNADVASKEHSLPTYEDQEMLCVLTLEFFDYFGKLLNDYTVEVFAELVIPAMGFTATVFTHAVRAEQLSEAI